jgi:hypothetical protein
MRQIYAPGIVCAVLSWLGGVFASIKQWGRTKRRSLYQTDDQHQKMLRKTRQQHRTVMLCLVAGQVKCPKSSRPWRPSAAGSPPCRGGVVGSGAGRCQTSLVLGLLAW